VLVRNPTSGILETVASRDQRGDLGAEPMPVSRSIVDYVLKHRQGVRTSDARSDTRFTSGASILQAGIREAICVPMPGRYDLQGVIYLDITTSADQLLLQGGGGARFTEDLLLLMVAIGRQAALAVEDNQYQQALVKSERLAAVGQTIAILSHHIKNILQGVRGGSFLIDRGLNTHDEPMVRKGWTILEKNQQRIYDLVMDMLSLSKERQLILKGGDLNETVGEACELLQARATELNVALEWTPQPGLPPMQFDAEAIHRAVLNIGGNALEAVEGGDAPCVKISTSYDSAGHLVLITVSDNGPGIPSEILAGLFNIFESSKGSRGTGIGLAVSRKIIREHGGDIEVRSQPGEGATFILAWPLIAEEPTLVPTDE
jgi:signal transduction histidine kinase